ncbi:MAG: shikimate kinase [Planctomycetes bacterium]|nr:shikimate kinase [Planctomycetota bacterium]
MVVTLIGYRGSGKSSVAGPLAERLGWSWVDADVEIERRGGLSIRQIFDAEGEAGFRRRERAVLAELLAGHRLVIAAGGGAVLDAETRPNMRRAGPVVWLKARPETLIERIEADTSTSERRPNLTSAGGLAEIEKLLAIREPFYRETASVLVDTEGRSVESLVEEIAAAVRRHLEQERGGGTV